MVSWKLGLKWKYDFKLCCAWKVLKCFKIVLWFFFCSVDLLDDGAKEFNSEKINGDVIDFHGQNLNILVSTFTWKNMLTISDGHSFIFLIWRRKIQIWKKNCFGLWKYAVDRFSWTEVGYPSNFRWKVGHLLSVAFSEIGHFLPLWGICRVWRAYESYCPCGPPN